MVEVGTYDIKISQLYFVVGVYLLFMQKNCKSSEANNTDIYELLPCTYATRATITIPVRVADHKQHNRLTDR